MLPLWLSPTQVRILPISDKFKEAAEKVADELTQQNIRVDVDDRSDTLQKKIRNTEMDWVPFSIAFGEKEISSGKLAVRFRESGKVEQMEAKDLVKKISDETRGKPYRPLSVPRLLSKRPIF
jgi:threonyl-tRNA synthetase